MGVTAQAEWLHELFRKRCIYIMAHIWELKATSDIVLEKVEISHNCSAVCE